MINVFIKGQSLKVVAPVIVSDSIKYLEAKFHFQTSDWDGFSKWAHFSKGDTVYDIRLNEDDAITKSENLNLSAGEWAVYIHGTSDDGERITTEKAFVEVKESGVLDGEPFPNAPLTALEQIDNRVSKLEKSGVSKEQIGDLNDLHTKDKSSVVSAINEVLRTGTVPADMESTKNRVTVIDENSDDEHYPTAKAVYNVVGDVEAALDAIIEIQRVYLSMGVAE